LPLLTWVSATARNQPVSSLSKLQRFRVNRPAPAALPHRRILSWNKLVVQSLQSAAYHGIGFAIPLCRWPFPRLCGFPKADLSRVRLTQATHPLVDFSLPPESFSIEPSRGALRERFARRLSWTSGPYSTFQRRGSTLRGPCQKPASVRLQGLVTLLTGFAPRRLAGLVSSRQRSWDFPLRSFPRSQGDQRVSASIEPACR
jgi:hypothetical protein